MITTNGNVAGGGEILGDTTIAAAMLDRLSQRSVGLNLDGDSDRIGDCHARWRIPTARGRDLRLRLNSHQGRPVRARHDRGPTSGPSSATGHSVILDDQAGAVSATPDISAAGTVSNTRASRDLNASELVPPDIAVL